MRKKREGLPENHQDNLSSRYRRIGIKAVAAALQPEGKEKATHQKKAAKREEVENRRQGSLDANSALSLPIPEPA